MKTFTETRNVTDQEKQHFAILIVDDEHAILDVIQESLSTENFLSDTATDGKKALEALAQREYDLVITDIHMPGMTGVEVARTISGLNEKTRVIFITGYTEYDTVLQAITTHPFGYLQKPFTSRQIIELTNKAFDDWCNVREKEDAYVSLQKAVIERESDLQFQNERLMAEKELLQGMISQANFGLIAVDTNQTVHMLNAYVVDALAIGKEFTNAFHGLPLQQVLTPHVFESFQSLYDRVMEDGTLCETINVDQGTERERHIIAYPIIFRGETSAVVFVVHDITEKQILQKRLVQSAKLASIGELAAGVAHEINNPLGFVTSNCNRLTEYCGNLIMFCDSQDNLIKELGTNDNRSLIINKRDDLKSQYDFDFIREDIKDLLEETKDGLTRVSKIVRDLKSFARLDDDTPESHAINDLLNDALNLVRNEIKYKLHVIKNYGDLKDIQCFPNQLVQVFTNLFINASHAIEDHGTLEINTSGNDSLARIVVRDDGSGIPDHVLPKIFDPFFTTKGQGKGTGMGLSISYGIIEKHGGKITADSTLGEGTAFTITLPYNKAETLATEMTGRVSERG